MDFAYTYMLVTRTLIVCAFLLTDAFYV